MPSYYDYTVPNLIGSSIENHLRSSGIQNDLGQYLIQMQIRYNLVKHNIWSKYDVVAMPQVGNGAWGGFCKVRVVVQVWIHHRRISAPIEKASEKMQSNGPGETKIELGRNPIASKSKKVRKPDNTNQPIDVQIQHLCTYRENKMKDLFSKEADAIICWCKKLNFDVIVVGKNSGWKQNANMGSVNNQKFVYIPFEKFIQQLVYRAKRENIYLLLQEESYTSQASFLDNDPIPTYQEGDTTVYKFSGIRGPTVNAAGMTKPKKADGKGNPRYRGLYMAKDGTIINADLNASANIGRKALPKMFIDGQKPDFNRVIVIKNPDDTKEELLKSTEQPDNKES